MRSYFRYNFIARFSLKYFVFFHDLREFVHIYSSWLHACQILHSVFLLALLIHFLVPQPFDHLDLVLTRLLMPSPTHVQAVLLQSKLQQVIRALILRYSV